MGRAREATAQLTINLAAIMLAGVLTLLPERTPYERRRRRHLDDVGRVAAGLPGRPKGGAGHPPVIRSPR